MRAGASILVLAGLFGCEPNVLWHARTSDRRALIEVLSDGGERVAVDGQRHDPYDRIVVTELALDGPIYVGERGGAFVVTPDGRLGPFDEVRELETADGAIAFAAREGEAWRVWLRSVDGTLEPVGPELGSVVPGTLSIDRGRIAFVGLPRAASGAAGAQRLYWGRQGAAWDPVRDGSPPSSAARMLGWTERGVIGILREDGAERLVLGGDGGLEVLAAGYEEILEPVLVEGGFAFLGARADDVVLVHGRLDREAALDAAPVAAVVLTHLRLSSDGAHTSVLLPEDGRISLLVDGRAVSAHRRIDGERTQFVPGTHLVAYVAEDVQAPRVVVVGPGEGGALLRWESDRYAEIEGPVVARGRLGFVGRGPLGRTGAEVVLVEVGDAIASTTVLEGAEWAGSLRLGAHGHAIAVRQASERWVVTDRGRWPIPRFFVDTLVVDEAGEHWAAVVPDAAERELTVWIDGEPGAEVDLDELSSLAVRAGGTTDAPAILQAITRAELAAGTSPR